MAALTFVLECDGFQHGTTEPFQLKCLAIACGKTKSTYTRYFDTMGLLTRQPDALCTYQFQSEYHGWPLASTGLPQAAASTVLFHAIQDSLFQLLENASAMPASLVLWTKGAAKTQFTRTLVAQTVLTIPIFVRNLEELDCPPARVLRPTEDPATVDKAKIYACWLIAHDWDEKTD